MSNPSMLLFSVGGMAIGLAIDCAVTPPALLASLCLGSDSFLARAQLHWMLMPATHVLMLIAAVAGAHTRADAIACVAMVAGMALGSELAPRVSTGLGLSPFAALVAAMVLGMIGGMAAMVAAMKTPGRMAVRA